MTHRYTLPTHPTEREVASARLWAAGAQGVWEQPEAVAGWFADDQAPVPEGGDWTVEEERDWQADWKATIEPVIAGPVALVPTWLAEGWVVPDGIETVVVMDPGQAFGSGHHATTTLCTEALAAMDLTGQSLFDVGTGTGVLAIVAAKRGAGRVLAVDIDPHAAEITAENVVANDLTVGPDGIEVGVGSADSSPDEFDIVAANLMTDVITALAADLAARVRPGGLLVVSGIDALRVATPATALAGQGLVEVDRQVRDGWVGAVWSRPAG